MPGCSGSDATDTGMFGKVDVSGAGVCVYVFYQPAVLISNQLFVFEYIFITY